MAGKKQRRNRKISQILVVVLVILIVVAVLIFASKKDENTNSDKSKESMPLVLDYNLEITEINSYDGFFVEDGTDEEVEDIMMIVIKNNGDQALQYAELSMMVEGQTAEFSFSTLLPGKEMVVLEKNRLKYKDVDVLDAELKNVVFFSEEISMHEDIFEISQMDGAFNIKNISEDTIKGPVAIYYKNCVDDVYQGGITYRSVIENDISAGEIIQVMTKHFSLEKSEMMFVTFAP